jgi:lipopolysaccharide transport system ATP-binding protein
MYVRLAFAIAAYLDPEILIVDEVLAVGDAEFQKKCLGKLSDVASGGRTVLFVSHNMEAIRRVCATGLLLVSGRVEVRDSVDKCIDRYYSKISLQNSHILEFRHSVSDNPHIVRIEILDENDNPLPRPYTWGYAKFRIFFSSRVSIPGASVELVISTVGGTVLTLCSTSPDSAYKMRIEPGEGFVDCVFPSLNLSAGTFVIGAALTIPKVEFLDDQRHAAKLEVEGCDVFNSGLAPAADRYPVPMDHSWSIPKTRQPSSVAEVSSRTLAIVK